MTGILLHPSVFAAVSLALLFAIPICAWWHQLECGQRIYALGSVMLLSLSFVFIPFRNPVDGSSHWSLAWDPALFKDKQMESLVTPELVNEIEKQTGISVSPDFIKNSTTKPMYEQGRPFQETIPFIAVAIGWFFIPAFIDSLVFGWKRRGSSSQPDDSRTPHLDSNGRTTFP